MTVISIARDGGAAVPPETLRIRYQSGVDAYRDWALLYIPAASDTWIVSIHGHGSHGDSLYLRADTAATWVPEFTRRRMPVLTPNLRGNAWMSPAAVRDLHELLGFLAKRYSVRRFVFVGGSMGGSSNLIYAVLHPEDVAGCVALCPAADLAGYYSWCVGHSSGIQTEIASAIRTAYGATPETAPELFSRHSALANHDRLTMPVYIAHGSADGIIPVSQPRQLARALAGAASFRYVEISGGDHDSPLIPNFNEGLDWVISRLEVPNKDEQ